MFVSSKQQPTVVEVIEGVGMGKAQGITFLSAGALLFCRGIQMCLMSVITGPIEKAMHLTPSQAGLISSAMFVGMMFGAVVSGYLGDKIGRRIPVCISCVMVVVLGCATAAAPNYYIVLLFRFLMGGFMALGEGPTACLLSEVTPAAWRFPMRAAADIWFDVGYTYAAFLATLMDPFLQDINWRWLVFIASMPPGVLAVMALFTLRDSPLYLASMGRRREAEAVLRWMRDWNGAAGTGVVYAQQPCEGALVERTADATTAQDPIAHAQTPLQVVFGERYRVSTAIMMYLNFVSNMHYYGGMYQQPQVMTKGNGLEPGWELVLGGPFDVCGLFLSVVVASRLPRNAALMMTVALSGFGSLCFGWAGGALVERNAVEECVYQFGVFSYYWVPAMSFVVIYQVVIEMYPVWATTTGMACTLVAGRIGAFGAPMIFETLWTATGQWHYFNYVVTLLMLVGFFLVVWKHQRQKDPEESYEASSDRTQPLAQAESGNCPSYGQQSS